MPPLVDVPPAGVELVPGVVVPVPPPLTEEPPVGVVDEDELVVPVRFDFVEVFGGLGELIVGTVSDGAPLVPLWPEPPPPQAPTASAMPASAAALASVRLSCLGSSIGLTRSRALGAERLHLLTAGRADL